MKITTDNDYEIYVANDGQPEVWGPYTTEQCAIEVAAAYVGDISTVTIRPVTGEPFTGQPF